MGAQNPPSPLIFGANNQATNLQNQQINATGKTIASDGPKNYFTNPGFERGDTTGFTALALPSNAAGLGTQTGEVLSPGVAFTANLRVFTVTSANATIGATYTNNAQTFTVVSTIAAGTVLVCTQTGAPGAPGTLTKSGGTGDATITFTGSFFTSAAGVTPTVSATTTNPLSGVYSLQSSWSANTQGGAFISDAFTIDLENQAKVLSGSFYYSAIASTSSNFSGTSSNTLAVMVYDVTNAQWIMPAGVYNLVQITGAGFCTFTFQAASNGSQYQIAVLCNQNDTQTLTVNFDDFYIGPQTSAQAPAMSDTKSVTVSGSWVSNTTYTALESRSGQFAYYDILIALSGAPTSAALTVNLPAGRVIDTNALTKSSLAFGDIDNFQNSIISASIAYSGDVVYNNTTSVAVFCKDITAFTGTQYVKQAAVTQAVPATFANLDYIRLGFRVPIVGWSSNTVSSADTDTRVISFTGNQASQALTANVTDMAFTTVLDRAGAWNGTQFKVPVSGDYTVCVSAVASAATTLDIYKNGSHFGYTATAWQANAVSAGSLVLPALVAGDLISIRVTVSATMSGGNLGISRLSGPAVVQATESVNCHYSSTAGQSIVNATTPTIVFGTKEYDSHNAMNASTGVYTVPVTGKYAAKSYAQYASASFTAGSAVSLDLYKNSSFYMRLGEVSPSATVSQAPAPSGSDSVSCNAGDLLEIRTAHNEATARSLQTTAGLVHISIERVGN